MIIFTLRLRKKNKINEKPYASSTQTKFFVHLVLLILDVFALVVLVDVIGGGQIPVLR
ncbi:MULTISPECIES: hypothetical protein [Nostocales]|uniref:Uncharacterized protein n=3 Tax=Nostocales TaxID=1161 RepID=A0A8S9T9N5_9CYAN|nr:hypothetical protein [Tolypothrix bouteillei]KAF3889180.1 hypothetical protein DA73_0400029645 [Tolypothrix bouteillei VB521301]